MDPSELLTVRFHIGGEFLRIGPTLDYVGGDEAISQIERDKMSLQEVKGFLKDHIAVKDSMKLYYLMPGRELVNGLLFLGDDAGCMKMSENTRDGCVADIYVEYHAENGDEYESSGSDFEDEIISLGGSDEYEVPEVLTAYVDASRPIRIDMVDSDTISGNVLVPNDTGVITQVMCSPEKKFSGRGSRGEASSRQSVLAGNPEVSEVITELAQFTGPSTEALVLREAHISEEKGDEFSESEEDSDYVPHSDDSGEESEVVELRKKAKQFKKKIRASQRWVERENATGAVPIDLVNFDTEKSQADHCD